jgi:DNA-binding NarL/FixJ family response regulator
MNTTEKKTEIIIADNQYLVIEALKVILNEQYTIKDIVGCINDLKDALKSETPKLLILDYYLLDFNSFDDLKEIRKMYPLMVIVILSNNISRNELAEFNNMGIKNILHKNTDMEELFSCLEAATKGKKYYSDIFLDMMFDQSEKRGLIDDHNQLTASEVEIAGKKFLSFHTIMTHRKNILRKLGVSNASELIMFAIRTGIIDTIEYHI